ncbi:hypothetical protein GNF18_08155 [Ligilactobacillus pobuzihii]|uniref:phage tail protein n=1 Tax=Ligilactobacillus pobuzihii TaxID=449659 RepID=UPI0019D039FA|nr:phage tail protein [Ligilactobacillus pobuzihii]MBN7275108.1 hypothetical protein [Ligilactobacillus pobuzihii]
MYRILAHNVPNNPTTHVVYDPRINIHIVDGKLNLDESGIDNLEITINQTNLLFGNARPLRTTAEVYRDNKMIFRGRVLDSTRQMKDNGEFLQTLVFESIQNYLQDTSQHWEEVQNTTPREFFMHLIDEHNRQAPDYKQFVVRNVDVTNSTDNVYYYIEDGATTWDTIKDKLLTRLGGFIRVEYINGINYIDYLKDPGSRHTNTPIKIAQNLRSSSVKIDPTEVITQLVPLGATIENNDPESNPDTTVSQPRVDIKSVNDGRDYINIPDMRKEFGLIRRSVVWDDVHEPKILLSKAKKWIEQQKAANYSWNVEVLEVNNIFNLSDSYQFINPNVADPQLLRVTSKSIDFLRPQRVTLTISNKKSSLSQYQLSNRKDANLQKKQARDAVLKADMAFKARLTGSLVQDSIPVGPQSEDKASKTMPLYTLQVAEDNPYFNLKKGQKFAVQTTASGVEGLREEIAANQIVYGPATPTSDGLMSAADKEKLNGLQQYTEATEEQAGLMSAEDKAKLNKLEEGPVENVQIKDTVTGSIYLLTVSNGEIKLLEGVSDDG